MHYLPRFFQYPVSTQKHLCHIHTLKDKGRLIKWTNSSLTQTGTFLPWLTSLFQHNVMCMIVCVAVYAALIIDIIVLYEL